MNTENLSAYRVIRSERVEECDGVGTLLEHKKSGAHVFVLENQDSNKVFNIAFRTPAVDSTGAAHITEHSVLCGSDRYPVKDPFIELAKGSLNTFVNAMTYPDKTCYPVASTNDKDFDNLMSVYLDAVFHPNILKTDKIFRQEGWHYEMASPDQPLTINGVVYNEMKGAFSSADESLDRWTLGVLFPDTPYANESGGDPEAIRTLTYEKYLAFYRRYYHPSNSYLYLYGNCDCGKILDRIDREVFSHYDRIDPQSEIPAQKPFTAVREAEFEYGVAAGDDTEEGVYYSWNRVCPAALDERTAMAMEILETVLLDAPGAPVHEALSAADIGKDIYGGYTDEIYQPYFNITVKEGKPGQKERFVSVIEDTLRKTAQEGIPEKSLLAAINSLEFRLKESDYGRMPKGLVIGLQCMDSWLYDAEDPFSYLEYQKTFRFLRDNLHTGYFENLIRTVLLDNPFGAVITAVPKRGLEEEKEKKLAKALAAKKAALSEQEIRKMVSDTADLLAYQKEKSTPEQLATIPMLSIGDISREIVPVKNHPARFLVPGGPAEDNFVWHDIFTSGISYLDLTFPADEMPLEDLPYLAVLRDLMTDVSTENYSYRDLNEAVDIWTGGIGTDIDVFSMNCEDASSRIFFTASLRALDENLEQAASLLEEILCRTVFTEDKRIKELLEEAQVRQREYLIQGGSGTAVRRSLSYHSAASWIQEQISGIDYYSFLCDLTEHFEEKKEMLKNKLSALCRTIFAGNRMIASFTGSRECAGRMEELLSAFAQKLPVRTGPAAPRDWPLAQKNEAFTAATQVQYVARTGNFKKAGLPYTGALLVLQGILNFDYLWSNLREQGGAYGCMSGFRRDGSAYLASYRDPHLARTNTVYSGAPAYLKNYQADERTMTRFIIGAVSGIDAPMTPSAEGRRDMICRMSGISEEDLRRQKEEVLGCTPETIRGLAPYLEALLASGSICAVGSETKVAEHRDLFREVHRL